MRPDENMNIPGSFRDPAGFIFYKDGRLYRQVNNVYKENYDLMMGSGLYEDLVNAGLMVSHEEATVAPAGPMTAYKIIRPEKIPFISYPYEWSFSQLKDAALATLKIQKRAIGFGISLKDASAYNIQFKGYSPILVDTLSFEKYREAEPWIAYRQFCQHFLTPLALMSLRDIRLGQLMRIYIDGIPLDLASALLPLSARFNMPLFLNIYLHAKSQKRFADKSVDRGRHKMSRLGLLGLIDNLESAVKGLKWNASGTEWADYYTKTNYTPEALDFKKRIVAEFLGSTRPDSVWDFGANDGTFSRIAASAGARIISFDIDPACVEKNYLECVKNKDSGILPILLDMANPSPALGWAHEERMSLVSRGPAHTAMALALIHHLAIGNNLPFGMIADFFRKVCDFLIIEFVPKTDPQVERLLRCREDVFPNYTQEFFESEFGRHFKISNSVRIKDSGRQLYFMRRHERTT